ncbi:unnamed protein product [Cylicocyclus nassatus]|uniref:Netrin receptor UNC5 n=1 Tax=Cylicocyclus nassatus TaxID=53992 RepID=A0AA36GYP9_CYLNA|nr:unnamed protein product [Cylicocyclus nassatus]
MADEDAYNDYFLDYRAMMEEVVLIEQPQPGHVIKTRPYRLSCKALNARKIRFKCNSNWLDETRYESTLGTDPSTQLPYMLGSVEITKQEVEVGAHSEVFTCQCYASGASDLHVIRSDPARIRIAYMRKHFVQSPTSDRVPEGSTVQLHCVAPESDPKAQLTWIKDGVELEKNVDSNIIYANDGSLIISAARLRDSGNYTCEAANIANRRTTEPAALGVYVNGGWSSWSSWSGACDADCVALSNAFEKGTGTEMIPKLRRVRTCNNPAPLNGGVYCLGEEEEFRSCNLTCRLDGRWSNWSEWSSCSPTCHRFRKRTCTSPSPTNAGRPCAGRDLETVTCSEDYCIPSTIPQFGITNDATIYGGLACVFVLLAVIMVLCTALLCKRNKSKRCNMKNIYYAEPGAHVRRVLLEQQQKAFLCNSAEPPPTHSQFFTLTSTCSPSPVHPSLTLRSAKSVYSGYSTNRNAGSRAALITDCSSNSSSGCGKRTLIHTISNYSEEENYATLYDYFDEETVGCLETSQAILAAQVDQCGARLQLRKCGVALLIPENAVDTDRMIYVAVSDELGNRPQLQTGESVLSSVIVLGECEGESASAPRLLLKPVILSFRHCASVFPRDNWSFILYADEGFGWQRVLTVGEEDLNSSMYVHMENPGRCGAGMGWCHVMMENFARVMLAGRPRRQSVTACKRVHLAAYGPLEPPQSSNFELRIYCVPETGAAMESVAKQEQHGRLLAESEHFMLNEKGDLCFCVEDVSEGFSIRGSAIVEISETHHQWCSQNGLHCSITVCADGGRPLQEFLSRIVVYQKTNNAERHVLHLHLRNNTYDKPAHEEDRTVTADFHLPVEIKDGLSQLLDPPTNAETDWRGLAKKLHTDRYIQYFATRPGCSPTALLLDLWEAKECGSLRATHDLLQTLRVMGRSDAVLLVEEYLSHFSYNS